MFFFYDIMIQSYDFFYTFAIELTPLTFRFNTFNFFTNFNFNLVLCKSQFQSS